MKKWLPTLLPILGTIVTMLVPDAQHWISAFAATHPAALSLLTALGLVFNHQLNPPTAPPSDDTVAKIGNSSLLCIAMLLLFIAVPVYAQSPTPTPTPAAEPNEGVHFVTDSAFYQLSNGKQATVFTARIPVTSRYSGVLSQWLVPTAKGNISLGGVEFRETLAHIIKNAASNPDLQKLEVFARGQIGTELNSIDNSRNFAYAFEGGVEFPIGTVAGGTIKTGVRFGFLGVPYAKEHFELGSQATISPQVSVSF